MFTYKIGLPVLPALLVAPAAVLAHPSHTHYWSDWALYLIPLAVLATVSLSFIALRIYKMKKKKHNSQTWQER